MGFDGAKFVSKHILSLLIKYVLQIETVNLKGKCEKTNHQN